jgi:hypothetical protein
MKLSALLPKRASDGRTDNAKTKAIMEYSLSRRLSGMGGTKMKTFAQLFIGRSSAVPILADREAGRASGLARWVAGSLPLPF